MKPLCIAVSGLHRGDNPQPGSGVIRSIRRVYPEAYIIGLIYDIMESGAYVEGGPDEVHLMPYPSAGGISFFQRLDGLRRKRPIDVFLPTLDAEIEVLVHLPDEFAQRNIRVSLPGVEVLQRRAKQHLPALAKACGIAVPETRIAHDVAGVGHAAHELGYPLMVKGPYYDAKMVHDTAHAQAAAAHLLSGWGAPVILQRCVAGPEFNVLGLGDGEGGMLGQCSLRKTVLSDKGKGMGGIVVNDERLAQLSGKLIGELCWDGPFEIELIYDEARKEYVLIEINPRFPAWIDFPSMIGANFVVALVDLLMGGEPARPLAACTPGTFFLRHQVEVVGEVSRYAQLLAEDSASLDTLDDDDFPDAQSVRTVHP